MKKLFIILLLMSSYVTVTSASAQFHGYVRGGYYRPYIVHRYYYYDPFFSPYWYGYPYYMYPYGYPPSPRASKLDQEIADLEHDYSQKIASVRMNHSLSRPERRSRIRELRHQRNEAIENAKRDYYKS